MASIIIIWMSVKATDEKTHLLQLALALTRAPRASTFLLRNRHAEIGSACRTRRGVPDGNQAIADLAHHNSAGRTACSRRLDSIELGLPVGPDLVYRDDLLGLGADALPPRLAVAARRRRQRLGAQRQGLAEAAVALVGRRAECVRGNGRRASARRAKRCADATRRVAGDRRGALVDDTKVGLDTERAARRLAFKVSHSGVGTLDLDETLGTQGLVAAATRVNVGRVVLVNVSAARHAHKARLTRKQIGHSTAPR